MEFVLKSFKELISSELYDILKLRSSVFVIEQCCIYQDMDDKDQKGYHLMGYHDGTFIAYARLLAAGAAYTEPSIGRVAVTKAYRKKGAGKELMHKAVKATREQFNEKEIVISAQQYLEKFYTDLGFVKEGEVYQEDDIPHVKMRYTWKD